jgi:magnesium-transporting ATPase (P-type)
MTSSGDVILLAEGDRISADGRLGRKSELRVDRARYRRKAYPVAKTSDPS